MMSCLLTWAHTKKIFYFRLNCNFVLKLLACITWENDISGPRRDSHIKRIGCLKKILKELPGRPFCGRDLKSLLFPVIFLSSKP